MATTIPDGYGLAAIEYTGGPGTPPYVCTFGVSLIGLTGSYVDAANQIKANWATSWRADTANTVAINRCVLTVGDSSTGNGSVESNTPPLQGQNTSTMAPFSLAIIARKTTDILGRKGRGRCFIPCVVDRGQVGVDLNIPAENATSFATKWNAFILGLATPPVGEATPMVLLHNGPTTPTPVTGGTVGRRLGIVRDRN